MIRNKFAAAAFGLLLALPLTAQPSLAQHMGGFDHHGGPGGPGMHDGSRFLMLLRSANLTAAQEGQVHLIMNNNRAQMQSLHQQLMSLHEKISDRLLSPGAVNAADLKPLVDKASRIEATLNQNMTETAIAIRNVLTPAQISKLAETHAKLESIHKQIKGIMGPSPDMPPPDDDN